MTGDNLTGEGGLLIHGRLCLDNFDRGDLFSQELDRKLSSVVCGVCLAPSRYNINTSLLELQTINRRGCTITEKAPTRRRRQY